MPGRTLCLAIVSVFFLAPATNSFAQSAKGGPTVFVEAGGRFHWYRNDTDWPYIHFGATAVNLGGIFGASFGRTVQPRGAGWFFNDSVRSSGLTESVAVDAARRDIDLTQASFRIQKAGVVAFGLRLAPWLEMSYRFTSDSWRYERPNNPVGTSIPFIKARNRTSAILVSLERNLVPLRQKWSLSGGLEIGYGKTSVRFRNGVEEFLRDSDGRVIETVRGTSMPRAVWVGIGFGETRSGRPSVLFPVVKIDLNRSVLSGGARLRSRTISIGVLFN